MKKIWFVILFCIMAATGARADLVASMTVFVPHTKIESNLVNNNFNGIVNVVNGLIDYLNLKNLGVTNAKIANATIQAGKMECSSYWDNLTLCDGAADISVDHRHYASDTVIVGYGGWSSVQDLASSTAAIASYVGYSTATTPATTTYQMIFSGYSVDYSTAFVSPYANATPTISIAVATGTATGGIVVDISSDIVISSTTYCQIDLPVCVNGIPLSLNGSSEKRQFVLALACSGCAVASNATKKIFYTPISGWDSTRTNTVSLCSPYVHYLSTSCDASSSAKFFTMGLYLLR